MLCWRVQRNASHAARVNPVCEVDAGKIAALNDHARRTFTGCRVVITRGVAALGDSSVHEILALVRSYDTFTASNDPYGEHDFGSFHWGEAQVFWKIDYFDLDFTMHSPDPQ